MQPAILKSLNKDNLWVLIEEIRYFNNSGHYQGVKYSLFHYKV